MIRYSVIRGLDVSNGPGIGVSLFTQGCQFFCPGCFNKSAWDMNGGKEFTDEVKSKFFETIRETTGVIRVSILGGEPLLQAAELGPLLKEIKTEFPDKTIWLWTGYYLSELDRVQLDCISNVDYLVDGRFEESKKSRDIRFRGSTNQTIWKNSQGTWEVSEYN